MKDKKGISPLIATVLIIGFTIVLAALVITWGTKLFKTTVAETEEASKFALACTTGLKLEVLSATYDGSNLVVTMRNNNQERQIDNFRFIVNDNEGSSEGTLTDPDPTTPDQVVLHEFVKKQYTISYTPTTGVTVNSVDVYPQFDMDGKLKACDSPTTANVKLVGP